MGKALALLVVGLLPALASGANTPPPKEWQPLIDAVISALKKQDAPALEKLLMSFVEASAACPNTSPKSKAPAEELDKGRAERIAMALKDCNIMDWKAAKFVSASGGEPAPSKCDNFKPAKIISVLYQEGDLTWTIGLEPVQLNGKRLLLTTPRCLASVTKK